LYLLRITERYEAIVHGPNVPIAMGRKTQVRNARLLCEVEFSAVTCNEQPLSVPLAGGPFLSLTESSLLAAQSVSPMRPPARATTRRPR
jgi:hypothetical protein